jgi:hypothetical protein
MGLQNGLDCMPGVMYNMMYIMASSQEVLAMAGMVRKQIYIEPRQEVLLKQVAKKESVSEAELIRRALDRQLSGGRLKSPPPDPLAWEEAYQFMMELRVRGPIEGQVRTWKREELYEERVSRYDSDPD